MRGNERRREERRRRAATSTSFFSAWYVCTLGKPSKLLHPRGLFALRLRGKPEMSEFALGAARSTGAFRRRRDSLSLCVTPRDECPSSRQPMPLSETMLRVNKAPTRLPPRCFRHRAFVFARGNAQRENNETVFSGRLLHRPGSSFHKIVKLRVRTNSFDQLILGLSRLPRRN